MLPQLAVVYARCSKGTDQQVNSMDRQDFIVQPYLAQAGLLAIPSSTVEDDGVSGFKRDTAAIWERPGGKRGYEILRDGLPAHVVRAEAPDFPIPPGADRVPVNHMVVGLVDRLGRKITELLQFRDWCMKHRKHLHIAQAGQCITRTTPGDQASDTIFITMHGLFAEIYSRMISVNICGTFDLMRSRGELTSPQAAFGQRVIHTGQYRTRRRGNTETQVEILTWEPHPEEHPILEEMVRAHFGRGEGANAIMRELNAGGHYSKQGGQWTYRKVERVLHNKHSATVRESLGLPPCSCVSTSK
jgi:DNA invertase Pin-like site-specific DNA recombinase